MYGRFFCQLLGHPELKNSRMGRIMALERSDGDKIMKYIKYWLLAALAVLLILTASIPRITEPPVQETQEPVQETLPYWNASSPVMHSIMDYVQEVSDPSSEMYVNPAERIAVFDFDGTLYGELFPSYFDTCLLMHRALHDEGYTAPEEIRAYAQELEYAYDHGLPEPESDLSGAQCLAQMFAGMTVEEYRAYIRAFMDTPVWGFENMTYGEAFYLPMRSVIEYLDGHDFTVFVSSGSERNMVRELITGTLDEWIPADRVIGSTFALSASQQGEKAGRSYELKEDDAVIMAGNLVTKNQKTNKVFSIIDEIGQAPLMVFGNSSGDLSMARYALQHNGRGYMLLCDDTVRDYGNTETADAFAQKCIEYGLETISMKDDFETIYRQESHRK